MADDLQASVAENTISSRSSTLSENSTDPYATLAYQLTNSFWEWEAIPRHTFDIVAGGTLNVDITALTTAGQQLATWALDAWTAVSGIHFSYVSGESANMTFDDDQDGAVTNTSFIGASISSAHVNVSTSWIANYGITQDTYSFQTYVHEIGHALGLGHAGNYNGSATYGVDNLFTFDSWQASVMSYFSQEENTDIDATYAYVVTPMVADIIAIRDLYGTVDINPGDSLYSFAADFSGSNIARTIVDTGGNDTLDCSWSLMGQKIDLREEHFSNIGGLIGNLGISLGSVIENAVGGGGQDVITGNGAGNQLSGGGGDDTITGGDGNDIIDGGADSDVAVYDGPIANYRITENTDGSFTIMALEGNEGSDTLTGVEKAMFDGQVYALSHSPTVGGPLADQTASEDSPFSFTIPIDGFSDPDGDTLSYVATLANGGALPSWLSFDTATKTFSGTPADGDIGTISIKVTASDGTGTTADLFDLVVDHMNHAPVVASGIADQSAREDCAFSFTIPAGTFTDSDIGDALVYAASLADGNDLPSWLTFDASTGTFSGTPGIGDPDILSIRISASDGTASASDVFHLSVADNHTPVISIPIPDQSILEDQAFSYTFPQDAYDAGDTASLAYSAHLADGSHLPSWLSFDAATRTFSGTPDNNDVGTISVELIVQNGDLSSSDVFDITIGNVNDAPIVAHPASDLLIAAGQFLDYTVPADVFEDVDAGDATVLTATLADGSALPSWLSFDTDTQTFSGTPGKLDAGTLFIKLTANDSDTSVSDTFALTIGAGNTAPVGVDDTTVMSESNVLAYNVLANDLDDDGDILTIASAKVATGNGTVEIQQDGTLAVRYTGGDLDPGHQDTIVITYGVTDGSESDTALLEVMVFGEWEPGDDIFGDDKGNFLYGSNIGELIAGFEGRDTILGYGGRDSINGGRGNDKLTGGAGRDIFFFADNEGKDAITDLNQSGHDIIDLSSVQGIHNFRDLMKNHIIDRGQDLAIYIDSHDQILLKDIDRSDLAARDFHF